ncbi:uncharacterized protein METZ01_LOCUS55489, partial [marine metagenome]
MFDDFSCEQNSHKSKQQIFLCGKFARVVTDQKGSLNYSSGPRSYCEKKFKASSSIGRAAVSKTAGWGFDSLLAC